MTLETSHFNLNARTLQLHMQQGAFTVMPLPTTRSAHTLSLARLLALDALRVS